MHVDVSRDPQHGDAASAARNYLVAGSNVDPQLASLRAAARVALDEDDFEAVAELGKLIARRVQALAAAAPPSVANIADARRKRDDRGDQ